MQTSLVVALSAFTMAEAANEIMSKRSCNGSLHIDQMAGVLPGHHATPQS